jgi:hypothetical protein
LITFDGSFGITSMQTDDTLIICSPKFSAKKEEKIQKAAFRAKFKARLAKSSPIKFNGAHLTLESDQLYLRQKGQSKKLKLVNAQAENRDQQYLEQRARGAYLASICQPEAAFNLSMAAQAHNSDFNNLKRFNKRLKWQIKHLNRELSYVYIDLNAAKIFIFADGSFANNKNLSSQLGFLMVLAHENHLKSSFALISNIMHWSSTKCKRITRSILTLEIYGIINEINIRIAFAITLEIIIIRFN